MLLLERAFVSPLERIGWLLVVIAALAFFGIVDAVEWGGSARCIYLGTAVGALSFGTAR